VSPGTFSATDLCSDGESGANGAFGRVLQGTGKAKISQNAVAHEFGDEASKPADRTSTGVLITPYQSAQKLWVDAARQRS
jgi:hypothetical protein